jgi:flagellar P-ring protein precursor FlgI
VIVPFFYEGNTVDLLALIENINVNVDTKAKVVLNERTGTVVLGGQVSIHPVAISHGDLSIEVKDPSRGPKVRRLAEIQEGTSVSDLVKVLNSIGAQPKDLTAIFQMLKQAGALQAELEVI